MRIELQPEIARGQRLETFQALNGAVLDVRCSPVLHGK
jgi:hypothetical protein